MQTVAETTIFRRRAEALLTADEYSDLIEFLAANPYAGDEIVGTGGVRKIRFASHGRGKSGGVRVIYYVIHDDAPLYALMIYGKNERANLSGAEKKAVAALAASIKKEFRR